MSIGSFELCCVEHMSLCALWGAWTRVGEILLFSDLTMGTKPLKAWENILNVQNLDVCDLVVFRILTIVPYDKHYFNSP